MSDEQFHEFHLDGKQMVFLFMASTVVAVVIFLCGVMVGRGVRASKGAETVEAASSQLAENSAETAELAPAVAPAAPASEESAPADAASTSEKRPSAEPPSPVDEEPPPSKPDEPARAAVKQPTVAIETSRQADASGFMVQVTTLSKESDVNAAVKDLKAKGYETVVSPLPKGKTGFRVRVGPYKTYNEAKAVQQRLDKTKKYHGAWVTR